MYSLDPKSRNRFPPVSRDMRFRRNPEQPIFTQFVDDTQQHKVQIHDNKFSVTVVLDVISLLLLFEIESNKSQAWKLEDLRLEIGFKVTTEKNHRY